MLAVESPPPTLSPSPSAPRSATFGAHATPPSGNGPLPATQHAARSIPSSIATTRSLPPQHHLASPASLNSSPLSTRLRVSGVSEILSWSRQPRLDNPTTHSQSPGSGSARQYRGLDNGRRSSFHSAGPSSHAISTLPQPLPQPLPSIRPRSPQFVSPRIILDSSFSANFSDDSRLIPDENEVEAENDDEKQRSIASDSSPRTEPSSTDTELDEDDAEADNSETAGGTEKETKHRPLLVDTSNSSPSPVPPITTSSPLPPPQPSPSLQPVVTAGPPPRIALQTHSPRSPQLPRSHSHPRFPGQLLAPPLLHRSSSAEPTSHAPIASRTPSGDSPSIVHTMSNIGQPLESPAATPPFHGVRPQYGSQSVSVSDLSLQPSVRRASVAVVTAATQPSFATPSSTPSIPACSACHQLCQNCVTQRRVPAQRRRWRRVLYEKQDYADNYVDASFLSSLVMNAHVHPLEFGRLVYASLAIAQQVSMMSIFMLVFSVTYTNELSSVLLLAVDVIAFLMALGLLLGLNPDGSPQSWALIWHKIYTYGPVVLRRGFLFTGALLGLAPVLKTLTLSYSSDTIWALTIVLSVLHLALHDYGYVNRAQPAVAAPVLLSSPSDRRSGDEQSSNASPSRTLQPLKQRLRVLFEAPATESSSSSSSLRGTISLNAAIFAAVLLASRLNEHLLVPTKSWDGPCLASDRPLSSFAPVAGSVSAASSSLLLSGWIRESMEQIYPGFSQAGAQSMADAALGDPLVAAVASGEVPGDHGAGGSLAVFALIFFAFEIFAAFPIVARHVKSHSARGHISLTVFLCVATFFSLLVVFPLVACVYLLGIFLVSFVCPFWLKWIQRYKNEIQGPWDYDDDEEGLG